MAVVQVTVVPLGTATPSLGPYLRDVLKVLEKYPNVKSSLGPNGTALEGELPELWSVLQEMHAAPFAAGVQRVLTVIIIDDRRDKTATMAGKIAAARG